MLHVACFLPVGEKARQLLREQGSKKCASSKQTGNHTPSSQCGSEGGSDSVFTPELPLSLVGGRTTCRESAKDTPPSLMSPVTPASAGTASSLKFFPQQSSTSSTAGPLSSPSMDTPSSLDSGISISTLASIRERKVQDQNVASQPLMISWLSLRQDVAISSSTADHSRLDVVVGDNTRPQPVCTHKPTRGSSMEGVHKRTDSVETAEGYSRISSSEDEADGKVIQQDASASVGGRTSPKPEPVIAAISPMSDISDAEPSPLHQSESSQLNKFSNTFKPIVAASSEYSLAMFDASMSLQALRALKLSSMANEPTTSTYTMEVEDISGDESPELVVADAKAKEEENGVSHVMGDDMEMSDEDSNGGIVVESRRIEVGEPSGRLPISPPPGYPPPLMNVSVPPPVFGPTTPPFPPPFPPHAATSLGIPPPPMPGFYFPPGVPPPPLLGPAFPPFPPPLCPPLLEEEPKPSSQEIKKKEDALKCQVLKKAVSQLREVLMRDLQRRYIDIIGRSITDKHWEDQQQKRQLTASGVSHTKQSTDEPYRRMLVPAEGSVSEKALSTSSHSDLKRLTKFRIPTISRGSVRGSQVLVVRKSESDRQSQAKGSLYSDLSSVDSSSDWEGREEEEEEEEEKQVKAVEEDVVVEEEYDTQPGEDVLSSMSESSASETEEEEEVEEEEEEEVEEGLEETLAVSMNIEGSVEDVKDKDYLPVSFQKKKPKKTLDVADVFSDSEEEGKDVDIVGNGVPEDVDATHLPHAEKKDASEHLRKPAKQKDGQSAVLPSSLSSPPLLPPQFSKRSSSEEEKILSSLLVNGPDKEDIQMMRLAFIRLREEGEPLAKRTHWAYYPGLPTEVPPVTKRRRLSSMDLASQQHHTGCARAEGFYKIDAFTKKGYVTSIGVQQTGPATKQSKKVHLHSCVCVRACVRACMCACTTY